MTLQIPNHFQIDLPPVSPGAGGPSDQSGGMSSEPKAQPLQRRRGDRRGDRDVWRDYYRVSLLGIISAQTQMPSPTLVAQLAATFADAALQEEQKRWG